MASDLEHRAPRHPVPALDSGSATSARPAPSRPSLGDKAAAPVLVKLPPPFVVRVVQFAWLLSLLSGAAAVVYLFVIRSAQRPDIADLIRSIDGSRVDATYGTAADIVFWSVFGGVVAVLLVQITLLVSFNNRRPRVRWMQLATLFLQAVVLLLARELVTIGERGRPAELLLLGGLGLALLALVLSALPTAMRWSARKIDVRRGPV